MPHGRKPKDKHMIKKFHILSADYCPFCKYAIGAMMMLFKARNPAELRSHVKIYDAETSEGDVFDQRFDEVIPRDRRSGIPVIIEEDNSGNYHFVGGVYDFVEMYS